jgi:hypothetical protein
MERVVLPTHFLITSPETRPSSVASIPALCFTNSIAFISPAVTVKF